MSKYGHRFTVRGYQCPECDGFGENENRFAELTATYGRGNFGLTAFSLICELCAGRGWLTGEEFKTTFGISPRRAGVGAHIVSR